MTASVEDRAGDAAAVSRAAELAAAFRARLESEVAAGVTAFPSANVADLIEAGFLRLGLPADLEGLPVSLAGYCEVVEELATGSPATALLLTMPAGVAALYRFPQERVPDADRPQWQARRAWVAAEVARGKVFASGSSEPGISVLGQSRATAVRDAAGVWRLSGQKVFGSWGQHSDWLFSPARIADPDAADGERVEFFIVPTNGPGVLWRQDWNSFGMGETESHSFELRDAPAEGLLAYPGFFDAVSPNRWWTLGFAAVALGCVRGLLTPLLARAGPLGPAARSELAALTARFEAARAYLLDTARRGEPYGDLVNAARVVRTKTFVTRECVELAALLYAMGSGSALAANGLAGKYLRDVFAGTGLRPPYRATLDTWGDGLDGWTP